ncbi:hypothetical protein V1283_002250 [Bradyrhizobium sp. AZCC 2262]|uniref:hypothetical protein n=1 Tax=Bradyrhizobium sp. AZCC 2262 TaxID=3117022 RepID=UPI002FEEB82E
MAPKYHPTPLSGGDRKALANELGKARAMANILAAPSAEMRAKGEAMIQQADRLLCESWNERMWSDGEPIDPSPTIDQAVNGEHKNIYRRRMGAFCSRRQSGGRHGGALDRPASYQAKRRCIRGRCVGYRGLRTAGSCR